MAFTKVIFFDINTPSMNKMLRILGFKPKLSEEALEAYYNRLPEKVEVNWSRSGNFIIGEVTADGKSFMTQGKDADDFIFMVNDAILAFNEIPEDYQPRVRSSFAYNPPADELNKLKNASIKNAILSFQRKKQFTKLKLA